MKYKSLALWLISVPLLFGPFFLSNAVAENQPIAQDSPFCSKEEDIDDQRVLDETLEPHITIPQGMAWKPRIALTLDLCSGRIDRRVLDTLINHRIKATLFLTKRWMDVNPETVALLKQHLDLFEIGNHGARHLPPVYNLPCVYHLKTAGSLKNIAQEIEDGQKAIVAAGFPAPKWYRGATARYSEDAIKLIRKMGYNIAGFSLNGDDGASLPADEVYKNITAAKDGDVILAHMNHPERESGAGIVRAVLALQKEGYIFTKLSD